MTASIALELRRHREAAGMTQTELGLRVGALLGRSWPRQAVHMMEQRGRAIRIAELIAFAIVLEVPVVQFMIPPGHVSLIPGGEMLARQTITHALGIAPAADEVNAAAGQLRHAMNEAAVSMQAAMEAAAELRL